MSKLNVLIKDPNSANQSRVPYDELTEEVYRIRRENHDVFILGSSLLHPRHSIPVEHRELLDVWSKGAKEPIKTDFFKRTFICFLASLFDTLILCILKLRWGWESIRQERIDVLIKTWVPNEKALYEKDDFYFGDLPERFKEDGWVVKTLGGDGRPDDGTLLSKIKDIFKITRFTSRCVKKESLYEPEWLSIPIKVPLFLFFVQWGLSSRFRMKSRKETSPKIRTLYQMLSRDLLRPYTTRNNYYYYIARRLGKMWNPLIVVTPFEGQPWEKLFWLGIRDSRPHIKIIGYQHTVVMKHSHSLTNPDYHSWEIVSPDIILNTGPETQRLMKKGMKKGESLVQYGSYRRKKENEKILEPRSKQKTILVLPEGIKHEIIPLFNFCFELSRTLRDYKFIFRCHPVFPYEKIQPFLDHRINDFHNISVSTTNTIDQDFEQSSILLYSGSSSVLYAILKGLKPIFYLNSETVCLDPLYALPCWRESVRTQEQAEETIRKFSDSNSDQLLNDWQSAVTYVRNYSTPVTDQSFKNLQSELKLLSIKGFGAINRN